MVRKEIRSVLRLTLYLGGILLFQNVVFLADAILGSDWGRFREFFLIGPQMLLLIYALILGLSLFSDERSQRGMEYLLTLPYSRMGIIGIKAGIRFGALAAVSLPLLILFGINPLHSIAFPNSILAAAALLIFLISLSMTPLQENGVAGFFVSVFALFLYYVAFLLAFNFTFLLMDPSKAGVYFFFQSFSWQQLGEGLDFISTTPGAVIGALILLLLPFLLAFLRTAGRLDLRQNRGKKKFALTLIFLFPLGFAAAVSLLALTFDRRNGAEYHLVENKNLLEVLRNGEVNIYSQGKTVKGKIPAHWFMTVLGNRKDHLYLDLMKTREWELGRLDRCTGSWTSFYHISGEDFTHYSGEAVFFRDFLFTLEYPWPREGKLVLLRIDSRNSEFKRIPLMEIIPGMRYRIIGAGEAAGGGHFLLFSPDYRNREMPVVLVRENGEFNELKGTEHSMALFLGGKLLVSGKRYPERKFLKVFRLRDDQGADLEKELPDVHIPGRYKSFHEEIDLTAAADIGEVMLSSINGDVSLDLKELTIIPISFSGGFYDHFSWQDDSFYLGFGKKGIRGTRVSALRLQAGRLERLGTLDFPDPEGVDFIQQYSSRAIILRYGNGEVHVYPFPGLKELHFPGLQ